MNIPSGSIELEVEASIPKGLSSPIVVLAHPHPKMGGDMHNKVIDQIFRQSVEKGWGAVRFNFRGVGKSTGSYDAGTGETEDVLTVLSWTQAEFKRSLEDISLVGYSFGSWASAKAAARLPNLGQLVLIAPPVGTMDFSPLQGVRHSKSVFVAGKDEYASLELTEQWFAKLDPPKSLQVIPDATHFFVGQTTDLVRRVLRTLARD